MSYQALARQWRPRTFTELLGHESVKQILINALEQTKVHHAYLFTGTRGVGKTTIARLLAKSLNCNQGTSAKPCLSCDTCTAIEQGCYIDLIEVDAASKTKVEDTRDLLDNVQYLPSIGRYKIYLIDEVHMLSNHSFNALLKTLEEPPSHVKFLLATTDPQKIPATILSRCLQLHLKPLPQETIAQQLKIILTKEKITYEESALVLLADAAAGSMRDGLSLLDPLIITSTKHISETDVKALLGYPVQHYAIDILKELAQAHPENLLKITVKIAEDGANYLYVIQSLMKAIHQLQVYQLLRVKPALEAELTALAAVFTPADLQLFYQIVLKSQEDFPLAPNPAIGFDMLLLRLFTFKLNDPLTSITSPTPMIKAAPEIITPITVTELNTSSTTSSVEPKLTPQTTASQANEIKQTNLSWSELIVKLNLSGLTRSAAQHAEIRSQDGHQITLGVESGHSAVFSKLVVQRLEQALAEYFCASIKLHFEIIPLAQETPAKIKLNESIQAQAQSEETLLNDPAFLQLQQTFSGKLTKTSITSVKNDL